MKPRQINIVEQTDGFDEYVAKYISPIVATEKKKQLLEMAKRGDTRPSKRTPLGSVLCNYTRQSSGCYDPAFDEEVRNIRPDWFANPVNKKKQQLLKMAKQGKVKPRHHTLLGNALQHYTQGSGNSYDVEFTKEVRNLRPDWFANPVNEKKQQLFVLASQGEPRPAQKCSLGWALNNYTTHSSTSYDIEFTKKICDLRTDWFYRKTLVSSK